MTSLAADIGGTYSRLAWLEDCRPKAEQVFGNAEFDSLEAVIECGQERLGIKGCTLDQMVLALPGPVQRDPIELTNIQWQLQREALRDRFHVNRLTIVNDFQAAALGAVNEPYEHLMVLNRVSPGEGPVVVTGAGTGLGMAWLAQCDQAALPQATEGGHLDFAPNNADQVDLYRWLAERYGHVSYERILSGDGLLNTYAWLAGNSAQAQTPAEVAALAAAGDAHATAAIAQFIAIFGAYAGSLALAFNPTGGLYLCGGLTAHLATFFETTAFMAAYAAKGRMGDVVRQIPVYLVTRPNTGLTGAIQIAKRNGSSPWA